MRLVHAWVLVLAAACGSAVNGFQITSAPRMSLSMQVSATVDKTAEVAVAEETSAPNGSSISMTYADINNLAFRALQKECKSVGLSAVGTTAALRGRLLDHFGLSKEKKVVEIEVPKATAAEIEVSS